MPLFLFETSICRKNCCTLSLSDELRYEYWWSHVKQCLSCAKLVIQKRMSFKWPLLTRHPCASVSATMLCYPASHAYGDKVWIQENKTQYSQFVEEETQVSPKKTFQNETINRLCWLYFALHGRAACGRLKIILQWKISVFLCLYIFDAGNFHRLEFVDYETHLIAVRLFEVS